jgi:hypothetical protein
MAIHLLLEALDKRVNELCSALPEQCDYVWTESAQYPEESSAIELVTTAIRKLEYDDDELAVGENASTIAVVAVSDEIFRLVSAVNLAKDALKSGFAEVTNYRVQTPEGVIPLSQAILRSLARARYKRQEAYRHIFQFDALPHSIGFSQSLIRTVARKTVEEVLIWLSRQAGGTESGYYHTVSALPFGTELAMVKGRYNSVRANVRIENDRVMVPATLPIFIPLCRGKLPNIRRPKPRTKDDITRTRSDNKLKDSPLFTIGAISVYEYLTD